MRLFLSILSLVLVFNLHAEEETNNNNLPKFEAPKLTEPTMPKPMDRAQGSKAAAAAAMAASSMQQANCGRMMAEAMKEPDTTSKMMMMMMANQQCQQAQESMNSAMKNMQEGKKLSVSSEDIPKPGKLEMGKFEIPKGETKEDSLMDSLSKYQVSPPSEDQKKSDEEEALVKPLSMDLAGLLGKKPSEKGEEPKDESLQSFKGTPEAPSTTLSPIAQKAISYDETPKGNVLDRTPSAGGFGFQNAPKTLAEANATQEKKTTSTESSISKKKERGITSEGASGSSSEGSNGSSGGGGESSSLDSMLASLMGTSPQNAETGFEGGQDVLIFNASQKEEKLPNLFEYASFRFQKLAYEDGRVRSNLPKSSKPLQMNAAVSH